MFAANKDGSTIPAYLITDNALQDDNVTDELRIQGASAGNPIQRNQDIGGEITSLRVDLPRRRAPVAEQRHERDRQDG